MIPGEVRVAEEPVELNAGLVSDSLVMVNDGDRPIQVGSHLHLPDANPALRFDRDRAAGFRLDIPSGTSVRFEPGVSRTVDMVELRGLRQVPGLQLRAGTDLPTHAHENEPKRVVSFGTPGTTVEEAPRARGTHVRVSSEPARPEPGEEGGRA